MNILKEKVIFFNQVFPYIPKQLSLLFSFGFWALAGERVSSVRGNARLIVSNPNTAKTKAWRLLKNGKWKYVIPLLLRKFKLVTQDTVICLDFSDFHGWQILMFAIQTNTGRALPVYFDILRYPITKDSQNIFIVETIEKFVSIVQCRPKIVMDRGFACPYIIKCLAQKSHPFVVRVKSIKEFLNWQQRMFKAKNTRSKDQMVTGYNHILRLVVSDKKKRMKEPWYLVTNDFSSSRETIISDYYHRFEIEEFFKDAKWLLGLEWVRFLKQQSMAVVLWFVILGLWFLDTLPQKTSVPTWKNHHQLSCNRYFWELAQREKNALAARYLIGEEVGSHA